jgi:hypothetical protein
MTITHPFNSDITTESKLNLEETIERLTWLKFLGSMLPNIQVSVEERELQECPFWGQLQSQYFQNIDANQIPEVHRTLNYLYSKFSSLFPKLIEHFWLDEHAFLSGIAQRLAFQIWEAKISWRKFTNWVVWSLKAMNKEWNMVLEKIPYWAFWWTNVSLDAISYTTNNWDKTLRDIMEYPMIGYTNEETWEFFLPNSLWVSVIIQLQDGTIIAQQRNNKSVLTQYAWLTASASWAISIMENMTGDITWLRANAVAEVSEELGINPESYPWLPSLQNTISENIQDHILRELWLPERANWALIPLWLVMEWKRHNPEVVFTIIMKGGITLESIQKEWENAQDKFESIWIVGISPEQIEEDVSYYQKNMETSSRNTPLWLERYIWTLDKKREWAWPHLLMSYLAWLKRTSEYTQWQKAKVASIIITPLPQ